MQSKIVQTIHTATATKDVQKDRKELQRFSRFTLEHNNKNQVKNSNQYDQIEEWHRNTSKSNFEASGEIESSDMNK
jgi:hypothetical protein